MSNTNQDPTSNAARRRFDDVASLFGPIVPPAGSPVRPNVLSQRQTLPQAPDSALDDDDGPGLEAPLPLRGPAVEPLSDRALTPPEIEPASETTARAPARVDPRREPGGPPQIRLGDRVEKGRHGERGSGAAGPWPDAFVPRPNYRPEQKGQWLYWLFVIPFAAVVAVAVTMVDPHAIRAFIDDNLTHSLPNQVTGVFVQPAPSPAPQVPLAPSPQAATASSMSAPSAPTLPEPPPAITPPPTPASEATPPPAPEARSEPSLPAPEPPVEAAPQTQSSAAPSPESPAAPEVNAAVADMAAAPLEAAPAAQAMPDPSQPIPLPPTPQNAPPNPMSDATTPGSARITVFYRRGEGGAEGEARRVAARIGNAEVRPSTTTSRSPLIYYFSPIDREAATGIARTLAGEGASGWIVRPAPRHNGTGIEVLLPDGRTR